MKFTIATQEFNYLINKCLSVVSVKPAIPVLSNILLEASNGILTMTATDLTVGIRCSTEVKIQEEGVTTLPAKRLTQLARELTSANLEFSTVNEITEISAGGSRFRLHGASKTEFPEFPDLGGEMHFSMKQTDLKSVLFRTAFAVSRDPNRYILTGVFLGIANGMATFIGTDGKRLAKTYLPVEIDPSFTGNFVIPLKAIEEAQKNLSDEEGQVKIYLMQGKIAIETADATMITQLLAGDYPDVNRIIPVSAEHSISIHREELMTLLRQISLFIDEKTQAARFTLSNGEMQVTVANKIVGEGKVSMPVNYQGPFLEIAFNPTFFLDILRHSKEELITLGMNDSFNPGIIAEKELGSSSAQEASPLFVLMPMCLNEEG